MPFFCQGLGFERVSYCCGLIGCFLATVVERGRREGWLSVYIFTTVLSYPGMYVVGGGGANIAYGYRSEQSLV